MSYSVVDVFPTLQGEGYWSGRRAVFLRFAGCNLWDGHPSHRARGKGACARWCDTSFAHGDRVGLEQLVDRLAEAWGATHPVWTGKRSARMVVITGGEPTLQLDESLVMTLRRDGWYVAVETNGTKRTEVLSLVDWICVSPKKGGELEVKVADELKVVLPGGINNDGWTDDELEGLVSDGQWANLWVQPQDPTDPGLVENTYLHSIRNGGSMANGASIVEYQRNVDQCLSWIRSHPGWRLSIQAHKTLGLK